MANLLPRGWASSKVVARVHDNERSVATNAPIQVGELVAVWAGEVVTFDHVKALGPLAGKTAVQIDDGFFLQSNGDGLSDWINHSCRPNLGMRGQIVLVALRPIATDEELCFDYAMTDGCGYDEFDCYCGTSVCRGRVTGNDWRLADLQRRYRGYFSPYLAERIARQRVAA